jgi:four helix bundle protein
MDIHRAVAGRRTSYTGLRSQLLRAASGVPGNIVEGSAKESDREYLRYLDASYASAKELEEHLMSAEETGFLESMVTAEFSARGDEVRRMLYALMKRIREDLDGGKS